MTTYLDIVLSAPNEIPDWWEKNCFQPPEYKFDIPEPANEKSLPEKFQAVAASWLKDDDWDLWETDEEATLEDRAVLMEFSYKWKDWWEKRWEAKKSHTIEIERQKIIQWRRYWANMMVEAIAAELKENSSGYLEISKSVNIAGA